MSAVMDEDVSARASGSLSDQTLGDTGRDVALFPERYSFRRVLGSGAFKRVHLAFDRELSREVVVAVVSCADPDMKLQHLAEVRTMAQLSECEHIVPVYDVINADDRLLIIELYCRGGDLGARLDNARDGRLPALEVARIGLDVTSALAFAHAEGIVHRDLKPRNVLFDLDGSARLCDFGLAQVFDRFRIDGDTGGFGSPSYMSPEQIRDLPVGPETDLYALGCMLFEMLTGQPPFVGNVSEVLRGQLNEAPSIEDFGLDVSDSLAAIVKGLLDKDLASRLGPAEAVSSLLLQELERLTPQAQHVAERTARYAIRHQSTSASITSFVGRTRELALFDRLFQSCVAGRPRVVLVEGEAGIGKTRLLDQVGARFDSMGALVASGRAMEDDAVPYGAIKRCLSPIREELADSPEEDPVVRRWLSETFSEPDVEVEAGHRSLMFSALCEAIFQSTSNQPLLMILEDLHWMDSSTLAFIEFLVAEMTREGRRGVKAGLCLALSCRSGEQVSHLSALLEGLRRTGLTVAMHGMEDSEIRDWIVAHGDGDPSQQLVRTVRDATFGNPLFMGAVYDQLKSRQDLYDMDGQLASRAAPDEIQLPSSVTTAIDARTRQLSHQCARALTVGSFLGDRFDPGELSRVLELDQGAALSVWEEALSSRLVSATGEGYEFAHPLVRQAFYGRPSSRRREIIHHEIATRLERIYAESVDRYCIEIAHHLVRAGRRAPPEAVIRISRMAGVRASAMYAWEQSGRYFEAALEAGSRSPAMDEQQRADLHYAAGRAYLSGSETTRSTHHFESAARIYRRLGDVDGTAKSLKDKLRNDITFGVVGPGQLAEVQPLEELLDQLEPTNTQLRVQVMDTLASAYADANQYERADELSGDALVLARKAGDDGLCAQLSTSIALSQMARIDVIGALKTWREGLEHARRAGAVFYEAHRLQRIPLPLVHLGRLDELESVARQAYEVSRKIGSYGELTLSLTAELVAKLLRGRFEEAEALGAEALSLTFSEKYAWAAPMLLPALASMRAMRGDFYGAESAVDLLAGDGQIFADASPFRSAARRYRLLIRAHEGVSAELQGDVTVLGVPRWSEDTLRLPSFTRLCAHVELADLLGLPQVAEGAGAGIRLAAERSVEITHGWVFFIPRMSGIAAYLEGDWQSAERYLENARSIAERNDMPIEFARSSFDLARMRIERGDHVDSNETFALLDSAENIFEQYELAPLGRRVRIQKEIIVTSGKR